MEIIRGKIARAQKVVIYGPEGIGKTTLASEFPDPVFCDTEGGSHQMEVARTPSPSSWSMLLEIVRHFISHPTECQTFVLDTADWAERMCIKHVCGAHDQKGVESFGYGKGYMYVYEEFGKLLDLLTELVGKGITVVVTAHAQLRKFEQPDEMGSYDRYELKLSKRTGAHVADMLKEWCDLLLFVNYETIVMNVDGQGAAKGKNKAQGGKRVMYTSHTPSWDAKNRHGLPEKIPLDYAGIAHLFAADLRQAAPSPLTPSTPRTEPQVEYAESAEPAKETPPAEQSPNHGIPRALLDLMDKDGITEQEIMFAVAGKGYYPGDAPIANYDPAFVQGVLIAAWPQVRTMVETNRQDAPF